MPPQNESDLTMKPLEKVMATDDNMATAQPEAPVPAVMPPQEPPVPVANSASIEPEPDTTQRKPNKAPRKAKAKAKANGAHKANGMHKAIAVKAKPVKAKAGKAKAVRQRDPAKLDKWGFKQGSIKSQAAALYAKGRGATLAEVKEEVGSVQFNLLTELENRGFTVDRSEVKGAGPRMATRYKLRQQNER